MACSPTLPTMDRARPRSHPLRLRPHLSATLLLVLIHAPPAAAQRPPILQPAWVLNTDTVLINPRSIVVTDQCALWVLDPRTGVWRTSCRGDSLKLVGRVGRGPGEYVLPWMMSLASDTIAVWDQTLRRVTLFESAGTFLASFPLGLSPSREGRVEGFRLDQQLLVWTNNYPAGVFRPNEQRSYVWRVDRATGSADSIIVLPGPQSIIIRDDRSSSRIDAPFQRRPFVVFSQGHGIFVASNDSDVVRRYSVQGKVVASLRLQVPATPVHESDRAAYLDSARAGYFEELSQQPLSPEQREFFVRRWSEIQNAVRFPEARQRFDLLLLDDRGHLWIQLPSLRQTYERRWRHYSPAGTLLEEVHVPHFGNVSSATIRDGVLYTTELRQATDQARLAAYRRPDS